MTRGSGAAGPTTVVDAVSCRPESARVCLVSKMQVDQPTAKKNHAIPVRELLVVGQEEAT